LPDAGMMCPVIRLVTPLLLLGSLALGCAGEFERPKPRSLPTSLSFAGSWDSTWGKMVLNQEGKRVHGTFTGYREGGVTGELDGDIFRFIWDQRVPRQHGHGFMQMSPDGLHLEGRWGYLKDDLEGGRWAADRDTTN
jgi:hypothetical protein